MEDWLYWFSFSWWKLDVLTSFEYVHKWLAMSSVYVSVIFVLI